VKRIPTVARLLAAFAVSALAATAANAQDWKYSLTPYVWLPNINGTLKYPVPPGAGGSPSVESDPGSYLDNLRFAFMITGDMQRGRWSAFTDLIYLHFDSESGRVREIDFPGLPGNRVGAALDAGTDTTLKGLTWSLGAGYALADGPGARFEVLGGLRYLRIDATTDWRLTATITRPGGGASFPASGRVEATENLWDAVVGLRGRAGLGSSPWSLRYYADVGAGSSRLTWQAMLGIDYAFRWGEVVLAYRSLSYDQSDDKLMQDFRFSGPALGATFRF
jgi:opacity protein-like surface antigen